MEYPEFIEKYQKIPVEEYPNQVIETSPEPMVSCVISTYRHASYIRQCLESVVNQITDFPFEVCVGEDASDDGTREICIEFAERYPERVRLFLHSRENNIKIDGVPTGRFQGIYTKYQCRGKYIATCEGDDYWIDQRKLQMQVDAMESDSRISLCGTRCLVKKETSGMGVDMVGAAGKKEYYSCEDFIRWSALNTCTVMYRTGGLEKIWWGMGFIYGDRTRCISETMGGGLCRVLPAVCGVYRVTGKGIWSGQTNKKGWKERQERYFEALLGVIPEPLKPVALSEYRYARLRRLSADKKHFDALKIAIAHPVSTWQIFLRNKGGLKGLLRR
ncbi:MAG: glycosyltransferase family 2 protein [Opitutaceae bacterium]